MHTFSRFVRPYQRSCAAFSAILVGNQIAEYFVRTALALARPSSRITSSSGRPCRSLAEVAATSRVVRGGLSQPLRGLSGVSSPVSDSAGRGVTLVLQPCTQWSNSPGNWHSYFSVPSKGEWVGEIWQLRSFRVVPGAERDYPVSSATGTTDCRAAGAAVAGAMSGQAAWSPGRAAHP
jgi:hypothetical protein